MIWQNSCWNSKNSDKVNAFRAFSKFSSAFSCRDIRTSSRILLHVVVKTKITPLGNFFRNFFRKLHHENALQGKNSLSQWLRLENPWDTHHRSRRIRKRCASVQRFQLSWRIFTPLMGVKFLCALENILKDFSPKNWVCFVVICTGACGPSEKLSLALVRRRTFCT